MNLTQLCYVMSVSLGLDPNHCLSAFHSHFIFIFLKYHIFGQTLRIIFPHHPVQMPKFWIGLLLKITPCLKFLQSLRLLFPLCRIGLTSCPILSLHTVPKLWSLSTLLELRIPQHQLMIPVLCLSLSLCNPTQQNSHLYKAISIMCKWAGRNIRCFQCIGNSECFYLPICIELK